MNHRVMTLALAASLACLASQSALAQGLRPSSGASKGLAQTPGAAAPAGTAPLALPTPSAADTGPRSADFIVAIVNSEPVTNYEVRSRVARIEQQLAQQGGNAPRPSRELIAREVLERIIQEKVQLQLAREMNLKVDDYAVNQAEAAVAQQNGLTVSELQRRLVSEGLNRDRFREELRNQLLLQRVREREVDAKVRVSDRDIDQFIREQQGSEVSAAEINLAHVLVRVPEDASPDVVAERQARAQQALDKLRSGGDFATLAREYSDAPDGPNGAVLGLRPADRYPELFVNAVRQVAVGDVVGPLRSPAGFHILKVVDKTHGGVPTVAVQNHARHILLRVGAGLSERQVAERLEDLRQRVLRGQADFATLAREYSQDGSAKSGGDLGWAGPGRYVPEFEQALNALRPGEVSQPVVSRFGVHLIELLERREAKLTQREQRDMVRDQVREKKLDEAFTTWIQEARGRAYVEYRDAPQ